MTKLQRYHRTRKWREGVSAIGMIAGLVAMAIATSTGGILVGFVILAGGFLLA